MKEPVQAIHLFIILTIIYEASGKIDYCTLSCGDNENSACGKCEGTCQSLKVDIPWRQSILAAHNKYRQKLATGEVTDGGNSDASNVNALSYDGDLEYVVQCSLAKFGFKHDVCRKTARFDMVGQNLFASQGTPKEHYLLSEGIDKVLKGWFDEHVKTTQEQIDRFQRVPGTGHFTQLVWAKSTHVGCAIAYDCTDGEDVVVGCNYGPAGNIMGHEVYLRGTPASRCDKGLESNEEYPGLCGESLMTGIEQDERQENGNVRMKEAKFSWMLLVLLSGSLYKLLFF